MIKSVVSRCVRLFSIRHSVFCIRYYLLHLSTTERGFLLLLTVSYPLAARRESVNTSVVCDHFGLRTGATPGEGVEGVGRVVVAEGVEIDVRPGEVVLFVGRSGSGKSSLLRAVSAALEGVVVSDQVELGARAIVDELPLRVEEGLGLLTTCGLGEARLMLRSVEELSEGQRYRYRLAKSVALANAGGWVVADEFTATLDRRLAQVVAYGVRRLADQRGVGFLLATTHEDVIDDLGPDVVVRCEGDGVVRVERREGAIAGERDLEAGAGRKKKEGRSRLRGSLSLRPERGATGRTSLGGITGGGGWAW